MRRLFNYIDKALESILFLFSISMVLFLFIQIIARNFFDFSFNWIDEFARLGMVWTTFLGAALLIKERGHIKVDFFVELLPTNLKKYVDIVHNIIITALLIILIYYSLPIIEQSMLNITPGLKIPYGISILALPVGGIFMILYLLFDSYTIFKERNEG